MKSIPWSFFVLLFFCACSDEEFRVTEPFETNFHPIYVKRNAMEYERSMEMFDSAYRLIKKPGLYEQSKRYDFKVWYFKSKGEYSTALAYSDSVLELLEDKEAFRTDYVRNLILRSFLFTEQHLYGDAIACLYEAKAFSDKNGDVCANTELSLYMGELLFKQGKFAEARQHFKAGYESGKTCKDPLFRSSFVVIQNMLNSTGLCFERMGNLDSAVYYYKKGLEFVESSRGANPREHIFIETSRAVFLGNMGSVEMLLGQEDSAMKHFRESIRINSQSGYDYRDALLTRIKLGYLYLKKGQTGEAESQLKEVEMDLADITFPLGELRYQKLRWDFYRAKEDTAKAYQAHLAYTALKEKQDSAQRELPGMNLTQALFNLSQRDQLDVLKEKDQTRNAYLIWAIALSVTLAAILYLIRRNLLESRGHVKKLNALNLEAYKQNSQLKEALKSLEISYEENNRLMRTVAHDLRNPVGGMVSLTSLLLEDSTIPESSKEQLQMIHNLGKDSLDLMTSLLNFKASLQEIEKEPVDLYELLNYSVDLMQLKAGEKGQKIELSGSSFVLPLNREKMWRVFSNLLSNAIKFSEEGSKIQVAMEVLFHKVTVSVSDRGIGIPDEWSESLFSMKKEIRRKGTSGETAFGLGLAISLQIVEAHDGKIGFVNRQGGGTTFYVDLPRETPGSGANPQPSPGATALSHSIEKN